MKQIFIKPARPRRNIQCIAFVATTALVAAMLAQGIRVRTNVLSPWEYVAPIEDFSAEKLKELVQDGRFKFIASVTFLTTPTGSNQTFNVPGNWNNGVNSIQCIGAGASGGIINVGTTCVATGGGGGAYSKVVNLTLTPNGTATWQTGSGGNGVTTNVANGGFNGNSGGDTWFNGASLAASSCGAKGGGAGGQAAASSGSGSPGGAAGSGVGSTKFSGGASGSPTVSSGDASSTGGGGAAGPSGAGGASPNITDGFSAGGSADNGVVSGGAGSGGNGNSGTEFDASHGCGSGGGGNGNFLGSATGGVGASYGGGSGGVAIYTGGSPGFVNTSGNGAPGIIVVSFTPAGHNFIAGVIG